jgi:hypothetical protein
MFDRRTTIGNVARSRLHAGGAGNSRMRKLVLGGSIIGGIILWGAAIISIMIR